MRLDSAKQMHDNYVQTVETGAAPAANEYLKHFGKFTVAGLFLDRRLTSLNPVQAINCHADLPADDQHSLVLSDYAKKALWDEAVRSFRFAVWPDQTQGTFLTLRVSEPDTIPTDEQLRSSTMMRAYRAISEEGDGFKAYVTICLALLLGRRPVCIIDEPEMCLHPPQARNLGQLIARSSASAKTVTLVATHNSHILRGVLETREPLTILRLERRRKQFGAHVVPIGILREVVIKPTVRAESISTALQLWSR